MDLIEKVKGLLEENKQLKGELNALTVLVEARAPHTAPKRVRKPVAKVKVATNGNGTPNPNATGKRGRPPRFSPEESALLAQEKANGKTLGALAEEYNVSRLTIAKAIKSVATA